MPRRAVSHMNEDTQGLQSLSGAAFMGFKGKRNLIAKGDSKGNSPF